MVLALLVLLALIAARFIEDVLNARVTRRRAYLYPLIKAALTAPIAPSPDTLPPLKRGDAAIIIRIVLDLMRAIQGKDAERLVDILKAWRLHHDLAVMLHSRSRGRRIQALTLLSAFQDSKSMALLKKHARERDPYVQMAALRGLAQNEQQDHLSPLIDSLVQSRPRNTLMLSDILRRFGERGVPALLKLAQADTTVELRLAALLALAAIGAPEAVPVLAELTRDASAEVRAEAVAALGRLGRMEAVHHVLSALGDPVTAVKLEAIEAAGHMRLRDAVPLLVPLLDHAEWTIRHTAAEALHQIGAPGVALLKAMSAQATPGGLIAGQVLAEREVTP